MDAAFSLSPNLMARSDLRDLEITTLMIKNAVLKRYSHSERVLQYTPTHRGVSCNSHGFSRKCDCVDFVPSPCYNTINRRCLFLFLFADQNLWRNRLHRRRLSLFARAHNSDTSRGNAFGKTPLGRTNACLRTWRSGEGRFFHSKRISIHFRLYIPPHT